MSPRLKHTHIKVEELLVSDINTCGSNTEPNVMWINDIQTGIEISKRIHNIQYQRWPALRMAEIRVSWFRPPYLADLMKKCR